jgi:hypothetical protein
MQSLPETTRRQLACGHLPPSPSGKAWTPRYHVERGVTATVCPGYTCRLPEVQETVTAYVQWEQGTLTEYLNGEPPSRPLLEALATLKGGLNELTAARTEDARREKGA